MPLTAVSSSYNIEDGRGSMCCSDDRRLSRGGIESLPVVACERPRLSAAMLKYSIRGTFNLVQNISIEAFRASSMSDNS